MIKLFSYNKVVENKIEYRIRSMRWFSLLFHFHVCQQTHNHKQSNKWADSISLFIFPSSGIGDSFSQDVCVRLRVFQACISIIWFHSLPYIAKVCNLMMIRFDASLTYMWVCCMFCKKWKWSPVKFVREHGP